MTMTTGQAVLTVMMVVLGTMLTRFLPFLLFPANRQAPQYIQYLWRVLPFAVIGFLVVYCLKNVTPASYPYGIPEAIAILCVILLHLWKKNMLLSIGAGTMLYMVLVQIIFV